MPRKTRRTPMPPLSFVEPSLAGARLQPVPDVRAALNPKSFIKEKGHNSSTSGTSWVSPQFDQVHLPAPPARRRGRRGGCQSSASILDRSAQLSVKRSVARFPSLSFQESTRRRHAKSASASSRQSLVACTTEREAQAAVTATPTPPPTAGVHTPFPPSAPDDVDTPPPCPSPARPHPPSPLSQEEALATPCGALEEVQVLAADTPERDYGLKVTWRRRRGLMAFLKERRILSESDMLIDS